MLKELIDWLEMQPADKQVLHGFGQPDSYRGYYDQVAFEPVDSTTFGEMLAHAAALTRLAGLGGALAWSDNQHEIMRWVHADLVLVFYPHRTTAGNYHVRVRTGRCNDRKLLRKAVMALAENSCNFQFPTEPAFHEEGVRQAINENRPITH